LTDEDNDAIDRERLTRVAAGDQVAYRALAEAYLPRVVAFAYRLLASRAEAEEVAQDTFLRVWESAARFEPKARVATWIHTIAHHLAVDRLRKRRVTAREPLDVPAPSSASPGVNLERRRVAARIEAALDALPERQRTAITLVHLQGLTNPEAAAVLGIGIDAVESLLARGRRKLKESLAEFAHSELNALEPAETRPAYPQPNTRGGAA
jgi:RNA polymerase sigma-70 factor (ECF subfamily)